MDECTVMDEDEGVLSIQETFFSSGPNYISTTEENDRDESSDGEGTSNVPDMVDEGKDEPLLWVGKFINVIKKYGQHTDWCTNARSAISQIEA